MIGRFQELLNECIDIQEDKNLLDWHKNTLEKMKGELEKCGKN